MCEEEMEKNNNVAISLLGIRNRKTERSGKVQLWTMYVHMSSSFTRFSLTCFMKNLKVFQVRKKHDGGETGTWLTWLFPSRLIRVRVLCCKSKLHS